MKRTFRINAKRLYLTYSQIDSALTKQEILEQLQVKLRIKDYVIALEKHKDGGVHCHVLLILTKKCDIQSSYLDLMWNNNTFHGNYQRVKSAHAVIRYIIKENNYIKSDNLKFYTCEQGKLVSLEEYTLLQARKKGLRPALQQYIKEDMNKAIIKIDKLQRNMSSILKLEQEVLKDEWPFRLEHIAKESLPENIRELTLEELKELWSDTALAITGKSGLGKTFLAKTLAYSCNRKPVVIKHHESIVEFDRNKHDAIIFDDANLRHLKTEQDLINWLELNVKGASSNIRHLYGCKSIPEDTQLILTVNDLKQIFNTLTTQISRRLRLIELNVPITLNINVDNSLKVIFNQHNHIYNNKEMMKENQRIWAKYK